MAADRAVLPASTRRGRGTRQGLLDAARTVFERNGYHDTRITDITAEAGVAHGTFYAHFRSKPEVLLAVMAGLWAQLVAPAPSAGHTATSYERVLASNRHFLEGYRDNAGLFAAIEQSATSLAEVHELRRQIHADNSARMTKVIRRWQREGIAAGDVHAADAATALISMAGRSAYYWYVVERRRTTGPEAETLTRLWLRGLGMSVPDRKTRSRPSSTKGP